jgi:TetR/AcrR family transcriptional repressor of nem operon
MPRTDTLVGILRRGAGIVHRKGFRSTGLQEVLEEAGVPKGSFYHYFKSKDEFGLHLVDFFNGLLSARIEDSLGRTDLPPLKRLRKFFGDFNEYFSENNYEGGCPLGNLSLEMADHSTLFREKLEGVFASFRESMEKCLEEAVYRKELPASMDVRGTAEFMVNSWEGAVLRMKVAKDQGPLEAFENVVFSSLLKK